MGKELLTILIAASPIVELRGAIPWAIGVLQFSWPKAFLLSFIGNVLPVIPLLLFWKHVSAFLMKKFAFFDRLFNWIFARTRRKAQKHFQQYAAGALLILVAIPLPLTGAWTGTVAAFLFNIDTKKSFLLISLGVLIAGVIVTTFTLLGISLIT